MDRRPSEACLHARIQRKWDRHIGTKTSDSTGCQLSGASITHERGCVQEILNLDSESSVPSTTKRHDARPPIGFALLIGCERREPCEAHAIGLGCHEEWRPQLPRWSMDHLRGWLQEAAARHRRRCTAFKFQTCRYLMSGHIKQTERNPRPKQNKL